MPQMQEDNNNILDYILKQNVNNRASNIYKDMMKSQYGLDLDKPTRGRKIYSSIFEILGAMAGKPLAQQTAYDRALKEYQLESPNILNAAKVEEAALAKQRYEQLQRDLAKDKNEIEIYKVESSNYRKELDSKHKEQELELKRKYAGNQAALYESLIKLNEAKAAAMADQGMITQWINASPEKRKEIVEAIAITNYSKALGTESAKPVFDPAAPAGTRMQVQPRLNPDGSAENVLVEVPKFGRQVQNPLNKAVMSQILGSSGILPDSQVQLPKITPKQREQQIPEIREALPTQFNEQVLTQFEKTAKEQSKQKVPINQQLSQLKYKPQVAAIVPNYNLAGTKEGEKTPWFTTTTGMEVYNARQTLNTFSTEVARTIVDMYQDGVLQKVSGMEKGGKARVDALSATSEDSLVGKAIRALGKGIGLEATLDPREVTFRQLFTKEFQAIINQASGKAYTAQEIKITQDMLPTESFNAETRLRKALYLPILVRATDFLNSLPKNQAEYLRRSLDLTSYANKIADKIIKGEQFDPSDLDPNKFLGSLLSNTGRTQFNQSNINNKKEEENDPFANWKKRKGLK